MWNRVPRSNSTDHIRPQHMFIINGGRVGVPHLLSQIHHRINKVFAQNGITS